MESSREPSGALVPTLHLKPSTEIPGICHSSDPVATAAPQISVRMTRREATANACSRGACSNPLERVSASFPKLSSFRREATVASTTSGSSVVLYRQGSHVEMLKTSKIPSTDNAFDLKILRIEQRELEVSPKSSVASNSVGSHRCRFCHVGMKGDQSEEFILIAPCKILIFRPVECSTWPSPSRDRANRRA